MANARICDACGAYYDIVCPSNKKTNVRFNGIHLMWHDNGDDWYGCENYGSTIPEYWDLCDECQKKMLAFLGKKGVKNDTN